MSEQQYDIIFRGDIVFGHQLSDVKLRLQQLFKADAAKIDMLFTGKPVPLKKNLDLVSAQKYRDALIKAGAQVELSATAIVNSPASQSSSSQSSSNSPDLARKPSTSVETEKAQTSSANEGPKKNWSLAPTGADILQGAERKVFVPKNVDTSAITLRPEGGNLVDAAEQYQAVATVIVVPNYGLAEVGADLIREDEKQRLPIPDIDIGDWDIAELGADMINEDEKTVVPLAVIKQLDVSLAPVGADLEQIKPNVKPVTPDISKIRLVE
jgi:hypothetical protein